LERPGRGGKAHRDSTMRVYSDPDEKYRAAWHLLGLG
jgi:hypothetical protein